MKKLTTLVLASLSLGAFAATETATTIKPQAITEIVNSSELARADKQFQITYGGGFNQLLPSTGVQLGYFLDANNVLGLEMYRFNDDNDNDYDTKPESMYSGSTIELSYQKYMGNSFYIQPSVIYRNATTIDTYTANYVNDAWTVVEYEGKTSFTDLSVGFKIGNQWQWNNFTLGCDWIGITRHLSMLEQSGDKSATFPRRNGISLLNLYIGASF